MGIMWPSLVKNRYTELKLLCGNLCGRPPARPPPAHHTQSHNTAPSRDGRIKTKTEDSSLFILRQKMGENHTFFCLQNTYLLQQVEDYVRGCA